MSRTETQLALKFVEGCCQTSPATLPLKHSYGASLADEGERQWIPTHGHRRRYLRRLLPSPRADAAVSFLARVWWVPAWWRVRSSAARFFPTPRRRAPPRTPAPPARRRHPEH